MFYLQPQQVRTSPIFFLAPTFGAFSLLLSMYAIYRLSTTKTIPSYYIRVYLITTLVLSIITQLYTTYVYNFDISAFTFGFAWLLAKGTVYCLIITDLLLLNCYQSLSATITDTLVNRMKIGYTIFFIGCQVVVFLRFFGVPIQNGDQVEILFGVIFLLTSILYDNIQTFYLTFLVYRKKPDTIDQRKLNDSLKKTVNLNLIVCTMDWLTIALFAGQYFADMSPTGYVLQQLAVSSMGIHISLVIFVFGRIKDLTFVGVRRRANVPAAPVPMSPVDNQAAVNPSTESSAQIDTKLLSEATTVRLEQQTSSQGHQ